MASIAALRSFARPRSFIHTQPLTRSARAQVPVRRLLPSSARSFSVARTLREKYYTESHEWIELSADKKIGTIGVSAHAASALGDVVYVELPLAGENYGAEDTIGAVESVKSASDLYAPVAGEILESNSALESSPSIINKSPEADGWIAKIQLKEGEVERVEKLMQAEDYKKFSE